ncbi:MAG: lipoate--protein ligase family protein [Chloroflexi bacterium]|nr:lipoate--protein ligase family protein [Chloroflexota bacterium]
MRQMRLLAESNFSCGARNMAVDCAIAEAVGSASQLPTLRLYGWQPFCLSLGYGQRMAEVDVEVLIAHGWDLVRRPSGGKAILHGDELTYSLCLPLGHDLARGDVIESYRRISAGLLAALQVLGMPAQAEPKDAEPTRSSAGPVCFVLPSHYEIAAGGRKLMGSAQLRRGGALLQHGTLPLRGDIGRICDALVFDSGSARERERLLVRQRATTLSESLGRDVGWDEAAAALTQGFAQAFDLALAESTLSDAERARAATWQTERFGNPEYTAKR